MMVTVVNRTRGRVRAQAIIRDVGKAVRILRRNRRWRSGSYGITVAMVTPRESQALNNRFLKKKKPANVLSFDYGTSGEIIVTPAVARIEARSLGEPEFRWFRRLLVHGVLHLAGIHHEHSLVAERRANQLENHILEAFETKKNHPLTSHARRYRRH